MKKWFKRLGLAVTLLLVIAIVGFVIWAETPLGPMPEALAALQSDDQVHVENSPWLTFAPVGQPPDIGLILYPGGRVDARSYGPPARAIAAKGYLVVITPMPLNLAFLSPNRADEVIAAHPEIRVWVIGGHSLGGAMAAQYAARNSKNVNAVVLWASYPPASDPLTDFPGPVLSIYGTLDMGLAGILASKELLPADTQWVVIEGGNHAQTGWYGPQPGDNPANISRQAQQEKMIQATLDFLHALPIL